MVAKMRRQGAPDSAKSIRPKLQVIKGTRENRESRADGPGKVFAFGRKHA